MSRRVVITGLGAVTPIGTGVEAFWKAAVAGTDGIAALTCIDTKDFRTKVGGEVRDFDARRWLSPAEIASMGRGSQFACAAASMAAADAGLDMAKQDPRRTAVSLGTTMGEPQILEQAIQIKYGSSADAIPAGLPRQYPCGVICANVARRFGVMGPVLMIPTACAAGNYALGYAGDPIKTGGRK